MQEGKVAVPVSEGGSLQDMMGRARKSLAAIRISQGICPTFLAQGPENNVVDFQKRGRGWGALRNS